MGALAWPWRGPSSWRLRPAQPAGSAPLRSLSPLGPRGPCYGASGASGHNEASPLSMAEVTWPGPPHPPRPQPLAGPLGLGVAGRAPRLAMSGRAWPPPRAVLAAASRHSKPTPCQPKPPCPALPCPAGFAELRWAPRPAPRCCTADASYAGYAGQQQLHRVRGKHTPSPAAGPRQPMEA